MAAARLVPITAAMVRDVVVCERRVDLDRGDRDVEADPVRDRLWSGRLADLDLVSHHLRGTVVDLRDVPAIDRERHTTVELVGRADHVVGARIVHGDLAADVDVLSRVDGRWRAGAARAAPLLERDGRSVPLAYGVELAVAARILSETGLGDGSRAFLLGPGGERIEFGVHQERGDTTVFAIALRAAERAMAIVDGRAITRGEHHARCRLCPHQVACAADLVRADDLTLVAGVDRTIRFAIEEVAPGRYDLAALDRAAIHGAAAATGLDAGYLLVLRDRARHQLDGTGAYARAPLHLPWNARELHLSIDHDRSLGVVWSVGAIVRDVVAGVAREGCHSFLLADDLDGERRALAWVWRMMNVDQEARVILRSAAQADVLRALQSSCPDVCGRDELEGLLSSRRVLLLEDDLIAPWVETVGKETDVLAVAQAWGARIDDDAICGVALAAIGLAWSASPSERSRDAIEAHDRMLCDASVFVLDALRALPVGVPIAMGGSHGHGDAASDQGAFLRSPITQGGCRNDRDHDGGDHEEGDHDRGVDDDERDRDRVIDDEDHHDGGDDDGGDRDLDGDDAEDRLDPAEEARAARSARSRMTLPQSSDPFYARFARTAPDTPAGRPGQAVPPDRNAAAGTTRAVSAYTPPTLRVWNAVGGTPRGEDGDAYLPLVEDLPLAGAEAFRPAPGGGFALAERLRDFAPWCEPAIAAIERSLRIGWWSGRPWLAWRPLLLVGSPGSGKSRFAREVARLAGVPCATTDLGAASDALNLAGVARGWASAIPCWPAREIASRRVANPVLIADELDKAGGFRGSGGAVHDALLGMLEPSTARAWYDRCLLADLDLGAVCWIFTANEVHGLPAPLLSRLDVVPIGRPGPEHFDVLLANVVVELAGSWGLPPGALPDLPGAVVEGLRTMFARHRSARRLAAQVARLMAVAVPDRPEVLH